MEWGEWNRAEWGEERRHVWEQERMAPSTTDLNRTLSTSSLPDKLTFSPLTCTRSPAKWSLTGMKINVPSHLPSLPCLPVLWAPHYRMQCKHFFVRQGGNRRLGLGPELLLALTDRNSPEFHTGVWWRWLKMPGTEDARYWIWNLCMHSSCLTSESQHLNQLHAFLPIWR